MQDGKRAVLVQAEGQQQARNEETEEAMTGFREPRCPGRLDTSRPPFKPQYSRVTDFAIRPRGKCLDCGGIVALQKDGTLYAHRTYGVSLSERRKRGS